MNRRQALSERLERGRGAAVMHLIVVLLAIAAFIFSVLTIRAQDVKCPSGYVCLTQEAANRASELVDKYKSAQDLIGALQAQVSALQVASAAKDELILKLKNFSLIDEQIHAKEAQLRAIGEAMYKLQADMIARQQKMLTGGKTKTQRFLDFAKIVYYVLSGAVVVARL